MSYDLILKNGRVLNPATGTDRVCDIGIRDGKIAALGEEIEAEGSAKRENLSGLIVTPGLIDIHVHAFGSLGFLHPDTLGILSGVTAIVDAGGSGPYNYPELEAL